MAASDTNALNAVTRSTDNNAKLRKHSLVERIMSARRTERLSASQAQLKETFESLKRSLKALNGTLMEAGSGVAELKQAIRDAISRAETMIQKHFNRE